MERMDFDTEIMIISTTRNIVKIIEIVGPRKKTKSYSIKKKQEWIVTGESMIIISEKKGENGFNTNIDVSLHYSY